MHLMGGGEGVNTVKTLKFEKSGGAWPHPPQLLRGAAPAWTLTVYFSKKNVVKHFTDIADRHYTRCFILLTVSASFTKIEAYNLLLICLMSKIGDSIFFAKLLHLFKIILH